MCAIVTRHFEGPGKLCFWLQADSIPLSWGHMIVAQWAVLGTSLLDQLVKPTE